METKKYRKKPIVIEAIRLDKGKLESFFEFVGESKNYPECKIAGINPDTGKMTIKTLEGDMIAEVGDWVIKGIKGEFYPIKNDIFEKTYELVEEENYKTGDICHSCKKGRIALMSAFVEYGEKDQEPYELGRKEGNCEDAELNEFINIGIHACDECGKIYGKWIEQE